MSTPTGAVSIPSSQVPNQDLTFNPTTTSTPAILPVINPLKRNDESANLLNAEDHGSPRIKRSETDSPRSAINATALTPQTSSSSPVVTSTGLTSGINTTVASRVHFTEDVDALESTSNTGPYKQLWHLILGKTDTVTNDVVHEELVLRCNTIISGLIYYDIPSSHEIPKLSESASKRDQVKVEIMKSLSVTEEVAMELLSVFVVYEYKGAVKTLTELLPNELEVKVFVKDISDFYMRERLCVLYCGQAILSGATNINHPFSAIFSAFVAAASMEDWCKWLCLSLKKAKNEEERVQILHTLTILLYNYGHFKGVIAQFNRSFKFSSPSRSVTYAEGILMYSFLQSGTPSHDNEIEAFISTHAKHLVEFPEFYGAVISAFIQRCPGNDGVREVIRQAPCPQNCAENMCLLLVEYDGGSFRNKHDLTSIIFKCIYAVAETILSRFERASFGEEGDWNQLVLKLLENKDIARTFMWEQPEELTLIYTEALMVLPVKVESSLAFWGALCRTTRPDVPARTILDRITEINGIAKMFDETESVLIRPNGNRAWVLLSDINIGGILLRAGTTGNSMGDKYPLLITWELESPVRGITIWDVLLDVVLRKAYAEQSNLQKETVSGVCAIAKFLTDFSETSKEAPSSLINLFRPTIEILQRIIFDLRDPHQKSTFIALLLDVVRAGTIYNVEILLMNQEPALWPTSEATNSVTETILGYESVLNSYYSVTKTFLKNVIQLFAGEEEDPYDLNNSTYRFVLQIDNAKTLRLTKLRTLYAHAIDFILENIYPSFVRWRMSRPSDQLEIIRDTFRVFCTLFKLKDPWFTSLKYKCCQGILAPGNSLLSVLATDEEKLQDAWIRPAKDNQYLDQTLYYALSLMTHLANFDFRTLQMLDNSSNLTLVKQLGKLVRHRLNPTLPTLAINILRKIALELNISILACFGNGIDSFRDLLQQRLQYKCEAVILTVAILDFLTVCAQTQPGLIQHFFQDESSLTCLLGLLSETDPNLPVSALCLVRALIRKGSAVFKNHTTEIWTETTKPIKILSTFPSLHTRQKIISYTMNILSFEVFRCGALIEKEFLTILEELLTIESLRNLFNEASQTPVTGQTKKSIFAIKHFITLILARPDYQILLPDEVREVYLNDVTDKFFNCLEMEENEELLPALAELMLVLGPSGEKNYLDRLCHDLPHSFKAATLQVQLPLLTLIQKCIPVLKGEISPVAVESLVRVITDIFYHAAKIYDSLSVDFVRPLLSVAASSMVAMVTSPHCRDWGRIFQQRMLVSSIVCVAHVGLQKGEAPEVVQDALGSLIRLSKYPGTAEMLRNVPLTTELYLPLAQFSSPDILDEKWLDVYMLCCDLNSAMMEGGQFYFLEESLNFWTIHGSFIILKLFALTELINHCYLQTPDQNFQTIKQLLSFIGVIFHGISVMIPYFQQWRLKQHETLLRLMEGVLVTLETSVSLLSQPNHLLLVITKPTKSFATTSPAFKLTPQLLEVQTKLWEVVSLGVHIYLKVGRGETEFISQEKILPLLFNIIGLCGRAMSKHSDKKSHPVVNVTNEVTMSLEKGLALILSHVIGLARERGQGDTGTQEEGTFIRETSSEITTLCDMVRRLGLPPDDFSITMCSALEENIKEMLCK